MNKTTILLITLLTAFSSLSVSANYYRDDTNVLLRKITFGGYVRAENQGWAQGVEVFENGQVVFFERYSAFDKWQETTLAKLSKKAALKLADNINEMPNNKIKFPNEPVCADAATTKYEAPQNEITFAKKENCRTGLMKNAYQAKKLFSFLNALKTITP